MRNIGKLSIGSMRTNGKEKNLPSTKEVIYEEKNGGRRGIPFRLHFVNSVSFPPQADRLLTLSYVEQDGTKCSGWRKERDSNPRGDLHPPTALAKPPLQPLEYPSAAAEILSDPQPELKLFFCKSFEDFL